MNGEWASSGEVGVELAVESAWKNVLRFGAFASKTAKSKAAGARGGGGGDAVQGPCEAGPAAVGGDRQD